MTEKKLRRSAAVGFAALLAAGVIGGVTAVSVLARQEPPAQQVTTVSDESTTTATTPAATPSASPTAVPSKTSASPTPAKTKAATTGKTTTQRSQTLTDPTPAEPTPAETNTGTADIKPDPGPPPPTLRKCYAENGDEIPCPPAG